MLRIALINSDMALLRVYMCVREYMILANGADVRILRHENDNNDYYCCFEICNLSRYVNVTTTR